MAKQDVLDAINATIVENNQKGITAQALKNILTLMVENAGEGSGGSGALIIICPARGMDYQLTAEDMAHNAEVYSKCLECHNNGTTLPLIVADFSSAYSSMGVSASHVESSLLTIFSLSETEGPAGLLIGLDQSMCHVSADGSVTFM